MKNLFCLLTVLGFCVPANAQLVEVEFTGNLVASTNPERFGATISGFVTLDYDATPDYYDDYNTASQIGQVANWLGGNFSVDAMTSNGFTAGTFFDGGQTFTNVSDFPIYFGESLVGGSVSNFYEDGIVSRVITLASEDNTKIGDGIAELPDWSPLTDERAYIELTEFNFETFSFDQAIYVLTSFGQSNIIVAGVDTGIQDFDYQGITITDRISMFAESARNHGKYVKSVAKLTNELKAAGLISDVEKDIIMEIAAESTVGK